MLRRSWDCSAVDGFRVGDGVISNFYIGNLYGPVLDSGSHWLGGTSDGIPRQYAAVPTQAATKIPPECRSNYVQLTSLLCSGVTAWNALYGLEWCIDLRLSTGDSITTSLSDLKLKFTKSMSDADYKLPQDSEIPDWAAETQHIMHNKGDFDIETSGSGTIAQSIQAAALGGQISLIAPVKQGKMSDVATLALNKGCIIRGVHIDNRQLM
ncbi:unnamed protein product [Phytophthora lilii]|uniref:Unnamed protein product n=1 Tax=Phytophthora lilii TaxID=2077276 RepID=A0A9W6TN32_9STRA|nr:unnamed protein product [Phytophthora lilii]